MTLTLMIKLRPHQKRILDKNPKRSMLVWEMRTGKSIPAKFWSEQYEKSLIICLKANKKEWEELCPKANVLTKEEFKKAKGLKPDCVVLDEAHFFAAPLYIPKKRSQLAEALYGLLRDNPDIHIMLLTATPLTNDPASLHTLLTYIGVRIDWKEYRQHFYTLENRPYLPRPAWLPKPNWREGANKLLEKYADIVSLADCVDYLPPVTKEVINIKGKPKVYADDEEYHWTKDHLYEQTFKLSKIKEIANGHRKLILVCHYTEQINDLAEKLKNIKPVYVLNGQTKDQGQVIKEAQEASDCFLIVQAKMGMGWDGYMFGAMVFVSMGHRVLDHTQMLGRLTNVDNPKPCLFYYLNVGKWDKAIYKSIMNGEDFNIHKYETT